MGKKVSDVVSFNADYSTTWDEMPSFKSSITSFKVSDNKKVLDTALFDKVFYMVYEGTLRQFKILKGYLFFGNEGCAPNAYTNISDDMYLIEIAKVGRMFVYGRYGASLPFTFYKSVEDYKNGNPVEQNNPYIGLDRLKEIVQNVFSCEVEKNWEFPRRWKWDGATAQCYRVSLPLYLEYDGEGEFYAPIWFNSYEGYTSKEECEEDNEIKVVTFDDDETFEEKKEKVVVLGIQLELTESDIKKLKNVVTNYL